MASGARAVRGWAKCLGAQVWAWGGFDWGTSGFGLSFRSKSGGCGVLWVQTGGGSLASFIHALNKDN